MMFAGVNVIGIDVAHSCDGVLELEGREPIVFDLTWSDELERWTIEGVEDEAVHDALLEWVRREVGQLYLNGEHGACPASWKQG